MEDQEGDKEEEMTAKVIQQDSPTKPKVSHQGTNVAVVVAAETGDKPLVSTNNDTQPSEQSAEVPAEQITEGPSQVENSAPATAAAAQPEEKHKTESSQPEATATAQPEANQAENSTPSRSSPCRRGHNKAYEQRIQICGNT
ncbi:hypothetical protein SEMRO_1285_G259310.1 [Seminavis robusta]|uniref:Uncharacterized protein n=1 Tax=Seminavis robusta TaxID=568900 RepID=A0A9N8HTK3_9STRA|nr:hypothetical protein SEMRO_1285_G259310.1 [Seminavis robusta]|eukprot:Sro1285_g259310.1 n/a (142) ;mRNA; f:12743-13168